MESYANNVRYVSTLRYLIMVLTDLKYGFKDYNIVLPESWASPHRRFQILLSER